MVVKEEVKVEVNSLRSWTVAYLPVIVSSCLTPSLTSMSIAN